MNFETTTLFILRAGKWESCPSQNECRKVWQPEKVILLNTEGTFPWFRVCMRDFCSLPREAPLYILVLLRLSSLLLPSCLLPCAWISWPGFLSIPHVVQGNNQLYHLPYIIWHRRRMFHNHSFHFRENGKIYVNTQTCSFFWRTVCHVSQFIRWIIISEGEMEIFNVNPAMWFFRTTLEGKVPWCIATTDAFCDVHYTLYSVVSSTMPCTCRISWGVGF